MALAELAVLAAKRKSMYLLAEIDNAVRIPALTGRGYDGESPPLRDGA